MRTVIRYSRWKIFGFILASTSIIATPGTSSGYCEDARRVPSAAMLIAVGEASGTKPLSISIDPGGSLFIRLKSIGDNSPPYVMGVRSRDRPLAIGMFVTADICAQAGVLREDLLVEVIGGDERQRILEVVIHADRPASERIQAQVFMMPKTQIVTGAKGSKTRLKVQSKSYIAQMATAKAKADGRPDTETNRNLGFDGLVGGRVAAYELLLVTDGMFSENPMHGDKESGDFRLWGELDIDISCSQNIVKSIDVGALRVDFGKEMGLFAQGEIWQQPAIFEHKSAAGIQSIDIDYKIRGHPNNATIVAFDQVRPRACTWIWQHVKLNLSCRKEDPLVEASLLGSAFPSRKLWVNGELVASVRQGPFERLWTCDSSDHKMVQ